MTSTGIPIVPDPTPEPVRVPVAPCVPCGGSGRIRFPEPRGASLDIGCVACKGTGGNYGGGT